MFPFSFDSRDHTYACAFALIAELTAQEAHTVRKCSLVKKITQRVEYAELVNKITEDRRTLEETAYAKSHK